MGNKPKVDNRVERRLKYRRAAGGGVTIEYKLLLAVQAHDATKKILQQYPNFAQARQDEARTWQILIRTAQEFIDSVPEGFKARGE